ncbi:MAG: Trk system potassium transporter TrkA [Myxococcota bacterium]
MSILIIGGGDIGATLCERLAVEGKDVVVVEASEERVRHLREAADVQLVHGNGASPRVLREAGLDDAEMLIAVTNSDEVNLIACLVATQESVIPTKIARVRDPDLAAAVPGIFGDQGLDLNINPEEEAAHAVLKTLKAPGAVGVFEFAAGRVQVVALSVDAPCEAAGVVLADLRSRLGIECNIVAISRDEALLIPDGRAELRVGDLIYAAGRPDALARLAELLGKKAAPARRIVISGGGSTTYYLARLLEEDDEVSTKIIEQDGDRCKFLVERLKRAVVLHGNGTDPALLGEENVAGADAFIALTADDEDNVLSALLAKREGAAKVMALVNKPSYAPLVKAIGIDAVVSPNRAAVSAILHFIRKGKVVSVTTVGEEAAEALEVVALETSELVGRPLREAGFKGAIVGAIVRGDDVIIPGGDDQIEAGDHVVIFALRSAIPALERQMMVQLQYF